MVHFIEEVFQVDINDVLMPFIDVPLPTLHCLLGAPSGAEAVAVGLELHLEQGHDHLVYRLL